MQFNPTDDQTLLLDTVRRCLATEAPFDRRQATRHGPHGWSRGAWQALCAIGVPAITVEAAAGGLGAGAVELALVAEAVGAALALEPVSGALVANALLGASGNPALRVDGVSVALADGVLTVPAFADTRPTVRAVRDGALTVLRGTAEVVYHAPCASHLLVAAARDGAAVADALYWVAADAPGLTAHGCTTLDGQRAADLRLDSVRVDDAARVSDGVASVQHAVDLALLAVAAEGLGSATRAVELTVEYLKTRQQFGGPIGRFQALQHRVVALLARLEDWRTMGILAAARFAAGGAVRRDALHALKVVAGEAAKLIAEESVQLHGGMGMTEAMEISHHFRRLTATGLRYGSRDEHLAAYARERYAPPSA